MRILVEHGEHIGMIYTVNSVVIDDVGYECYQVDEVGQLFEVNDCSIVQEIYDNEVIYVDFKNKRRVA